MDAEDKEAVAKLLTTLGSYESTIPDELVSFYLDRSGLDTDDPRVKRLVAVAAQKFLADVVRDAKHHCQVRMLQENKGKQANRRSSHLVLKMGDLSQVRCCAACVLACWRRCSARAGASTVCYRAARCASRRSCSR